jgi:hypothetical protein
MSSEGFQISDWGDWKRNELARFIDANKNPDRLPTSGFRSDMTTFCRVPSSRNRYEVTQHAKLPLLSKSAALL